MTQTLASTCRFETERMSVGPWHEAAEASETDLVETVCQILTSATTVALPDDWRGEYTADRAAKWIRERDEESPTLLVREKASDSAVGFSIMFVHAEPDGLGLRIGYLFAEHVWGRGLASELVSGLVAWAQSEPSLSSISGGVDDDNPASARVLTRNGFERMSTDNDGTSLYRLQLAR